MKLNFKLGAISALSALAILFTISSCDVASSGVNFTDSKNAQEINELLSKHITSDMLVYNVVFNYSGSSSSFSFNKDEVTIVSVDSENVSKLNGIDIDIDSGDAQPNSFYEKKSIVTAVKYRGYKVENIDITPMITAINKSIKLMENEGMKADGLGDCSIKFGKNPSETVYSFKIQSKTGTTQREITYDEISFEADADGNLIHK